MDPLTIEQLRALIPEAIDLGALGLEVADPDPIAEPYAIAVASFPGYTGHELAALPAALDPLARRALVLLTLRQAQDLSADRLETLADFDLLQNFSAGGYSESRRSADDALKLQMLGLTGWPGLDSLLIGLMTPEKREELDARQSGVNAPAFAVGEPDWGGFDPAGSLNPWGSW